MHFAYRGTYTSPIGELLSDARLFNHKGLNFKSFSIEFKEGYRSGKEFGSAPGVSSRRADTKLGKPQIFADSSRSVFAGFEKHG